MFKLNGSISLYIYGSIGLMLACFVIMVASVFGVVKAKEDDAREPVTPLQRSPRPAVAPQEPLPGPLQNPRVRVAHGAILVTGRDEHDKKDPDRFR